MAAGLLGASVVGTAFGRGTRLALCVAHPRLLVPQW